jgi:hypothetical protein
MSYFYSSTGINSINDVIKILAAQPVLLWSFFYNGSAGDGKHKFRQFYDIGTLNFQHIWVT